MLTNIRRSWLSLTVFAVIAAAVLAYSAVTHHATGVVGAVLIGLLAVKLGLAFAYTPAAGDTPQLKVAVAVAAYNEDPATLVASMRSILNQTVPPWVVVLVDDGSPSHEAIHAVLGELNDDFTRAGVSLIPHRHTVNKGKREALAWAFNAVPDADVYVCVDSDTILSPTAISEVLKPFNDDRVNVVTGLVLAANRDTNLLTRLINLRYGNAFAYERAAYSRLAGSMLCACGSLAAYRGWVARMHLDDFTTQTFLGQPAVFGDDRRMTNYGLTHGRAVYQETAVAYTAVPERITHFLRQQVRWNKSFFRESLWVLRNFTPRKPAWWITLQEVATWAGLTVLLIAAVARAVLGYDDAALYVGYIILFGYARSVRYLDLPGTDATLAQRAAAFALAPIYGVVHILVLTPIRFWSLLTLHRGGWGTRAKVEVALSPTVSA